MPPPDRAAVGPIGGLTRRLFLRSLWVWVLARLMVEAVGKLPRGDLSLSLTSFSVGGAIVFSGLIGLLAIVDVWHRNERLLIANLGIRLPVIATIGTLGGLVGETVLAVAMVVPATLGR